MIIYQELNSKFQPLMNKYSNTYFKICDRAKNRKCIIGEYYEKHHTVPKSLGGTDIKENLAYLTGREHFICHWLLTKFTIGQEHHKMVCALHKMTFSRTKDQKRYIPNSRIFELVRKEHAAAISKLHKGMRVSKRTEFQKGHIMSSEIRNKISKTLYGRKLPEEIKKKMSTAALKEKNHRFGKHLTDLEKEKISKVHKGKIISKETKQKMSEARTLFYKRKILTLK